ncbi:MAG: hypothetical protein LBT00_06890 [Spirochaetaceae bacterium]|nr:hypothetical protein [Spirochaetaceae bacterium]
MPVPSVIASGRHIAERSNPGRTSLVWIASPTATVLPQVRNDGGPLSKRCLFQEACYRPIDPVSK